MIQHFGFIGSLITLIILTTYTIVTKGQHIKIIELFNNKKWLINFGLILFWSGYILLLNNQEYEKEHHETIKNLKIAVKKSLIAFIIAFLAFLDLTIAPYWLVFTFAYYTEDWI